MLKPYEMSKIMVAGPKKVQENVISELHKLKILHIVEHSKNELADIGQPMESAGRLSEMMVKVRSLMSALNIARDGSKYETCQGLLEIVVTTKKLGGSVSDFQEQLRKAEEAISKNESIKKELEILSGIDAPLESFAPYRALACFTGYLKGKNTLPDFKKEISNTTKKNLIYGSTTKKDIFIALFIDAKYKEQADSTLRKFNFSQLNFANISDLRGNAETNLKKAEERINKVGELREKIKSRIGNLGKNFRGFLLGAEEFLGNELEKAEAPLRFAATKDAFLIKGWVPAEQLSGAIRDLNKAGENKIFIHSEPASHQDKVPIKLKNEKYSKPFEFFINMYSLPTYREIDPTFFMFLTYPIFFGFMLGDLGYGLVSFALFYFLKKKMPKGAALFNVLMLSSAASIFFGFIYGEFFGLEEIGRFHIPNLISRSHGIFELMYIAVGIGVVHVNWGLAAGFVNVLKAHGIKHAIFEKASWFVLEIGVALLALSYTGIIAIPPLIGWIFFAASAAMLYKGEGVRGLIEIPTILTNTLSYLRLMAIGLSSVSIAVVVNEMAEGFFHEGGLLIFAGILILLIGHVLNIILGLFGSFLHSLRLHYVEFFSKFFEGGAEKYRPFGAKDE